MRCRRRRWDCWRIIENDAVRWGAVAVETGCFGETCRTRCFSVSMAGWPLSRVILSVAAGSLKNATDRRHGILDLYQALEILPQQGLALCTRARGASLMALRPNYRPVSEFIAIAPPNHRVSFELPASRRGFRSGRCTTASGGRGVRGCRRRRVEAWIVPLDDLIIGMLNFARLWIAR